MGVNVVWTKPVTTHGVTHGITQDTRRCVALDSFTKTGRHHAQTVLIMVPTVALRKRVRLEKQPKRVFLLSLAVAILLQNQAVPVAPHAMTMALNVVHQRHVATRLVPVAVLLPVAVILFLWYHNRILPVVPLEPVGKHTAPAIPTVTIIQALDIPVWVATVLHSIPEEHRGSVP